METPAAGPAGASGPGRTMWERVAADEALVSQRALRYGSAAGKTLSVPTTRHRHRGGGSAARPRTLTPPTPTPATQTRSPSQQPAPQRHWARAVMEATLGGVSAVLLVWSLAALAAAAAPLRTWLLVGAAVMAGAVLLGVVAARQRRVGYLRFLVGPGLEDTLTRTTLLEFMRDDSLAHKLSPFMPLLLGLSNEEVEVYLRAAPVKTRSMLLRPGLAHLLPPGVLRLLVGDAADAMQAPPPPLLLPPPPLPAGEAAAADAAASSSASASTGDEVPNLWSEQPPAVAAAASQCVSVGPAWPRVALKLILQRRFAGVVALPASTSSRIATAITVAAALALLVSRRHAVASAARWLRQPLLTAVAAWLLIKYLPDSLFVANKPPSRPPSSLPPAADGGAPDTTAARVHDLILQLRSTATAVAAARGTPLPAAGSPALPPSLDAPPLPGDVQAAINTTLLPALPYAFLSPGALTAAYDAVAAAPTAAAACAAAASAAGAPAPARHLHFDATGVAAMTPPPSVEDAPPATTAPSGVSPPHDASGEPAAAAPPPPVTPHHPRVMLTPALPPPPPPLPRSPPTVAAQATAMAADALDWVSGNPETAALVAASIPLVLSFLRR